MKHIILVCLLLFCITSFAQLGFNYKAVIKDGSGTVVVNDLIEVKFTILDGAVPVYVETHFPVTDANGIIILNIGTGGPQLGLFSTIDWSSNNLYLNVYMDIDGGGDGFDMGTTRFRAVPYAKHAENGIPTGGTEGQVLTINSSGVPEWSDLPKIQIGDIFKGGYVFYIDASGEHGLVAALADLDQLAWGCDNTFVGGTSAAVGTGLINTNLIAATHPCGTTNPTAAKSCLIYSTTVNGIVYDDWFLPSKDELNLMWTNLADSDGNGSNTGLNDPGNIGNFCPHHYWSSTEIDITTAWRLYFSFSDPNDNYKIYSERVRPIRSF